jgi:hypothetical protein
MQGDSIGDFKDEMHVSSCFSKEHGKLCSYKIIKKREPHKERNGHPFITTNPTSAEKSKVKIKVSKENAGLVSWLISFYINNYSK